MPIKLNYNYHTHTALCGHASGTQEEYVQRAISCGIESMGFSDHFSWRYPDGSESSWRVPVSKVDDYRAETFRLREKYKGQIEIALGFEMEYYPEFFEKMLSNAVSYGAEYLILGQHFIAPESTGGNHVFADSSDAELLKKYVDIVIKAMKTGAFSYVAHPDAFCYVGEDIAFYREQMRRLCMASKELAVPLELDFLGIRTHRHYPRRELWEVVGEEQAPVTFGFDAHDAQAAYDGESLQVAEDLIQAYNLNYIGGPRLIAPKMLLGEYQ